MAPSKHSKPSKKKEPSKPKTRAHEVLDRLLADQPSLSAAERKAFAARFSAAACEAMGGRTKSEGVLADALEWAGVMAKALKKHPRPLRRYGVPRFVWLLESIRALVDAREAQQATGGDAGNARTRLDQARRDALSARADLLETLDALVEGNPEAEHALAEATGTADKPDTIIASTRDLCSLAKEWLARPDAESKALVTSVGLTLREVEAAEEAAGALMAAASEKTIEGRVVTRDLPEVNRAEGRVLLEMRAAMRLFARANERDGDVPKLVPGKATRGVLAPKASGKEKVGKEQAEGNASAQASAAEEAAPVRE